MPATLGENQRRRLLATRRGVTVLVVMLLLAITLGLSYAMVRSQTTVLQIQQNAGVRVSARRAAWTGLAIGLKAMHTSQWCYGEGVDTVLTGAISDYESYQVTYSAGDPSLAADDADSPYRVTLHATGTATDPTDPARSSTHHAQAVVRLIPRKLSDEPADWPTMQQYTVYQAKNDAFEVDIPCRLEGPVRVQGQLKIAANYPGNTNAWKRYLGDLSAMRLDGYPDYRPFDGPVDLPFAVQQNKHLAVLTNELAVTANHVPVDEAAHVGSDPPSQSTYQIYPGGPVYVIPTLPWRVTNTTLEPDPITNPLGIYQRNGTLRIDSNVTIRGSIFCTADLSIRQANVHFQPVELPSLYGSDNPVRLPVAYCKNFIVTYGGQADLTGLVAVFDEFRIDKSPDTTRFAVAGRVIASKFFLKERQPWETVNWGDAYTDFEQQLDEEEGPVVPYFPVWMGNQGYDPQPLITVQPDPSPVSYHWKNPNDPIYVPHPDDDGLRWDLLEWTDNP